MLESRGKYPQILHVTTKRIGTGQLGDTARLEITYASKDSALPSQMIGKFASTDPTSLEIARAWSLYEREVRFYREMAATAGISTPICYGSQLDATGGFALLLEDLSPAVPGDQFEGLTDKDAGRAVRQAARLHAATWGYGENPSFSWLDTEAGSQPFYGPDVFRSTWPQFRERYAERLTAIQREVCDAFAEGYDSYNLPRPGPRCVTHNDFRPDNMLLDDERIFVVDWQSVALSWGAVDVAYLIGGSYDAERRREIERDLMAQYYGELCDNGVSDYSRDAFEADYRHFTFAGINVAVGAAMLVQRTERGDNMFLTMLERHVSHVVDHDALSLLRERP